MQRLDSLDKQVSCIVHTLHSQYGDTVTYKVRAYCRVIPLASDPLDSSNLYT